MTSIYFGTSGDDPQLANRLSNYYGDLTSWDRDRDFTDLFGGIYQTFVGVPTWHDLSYVIKFDVAIYGMEGDDVISYPYDCDNILAYAGGGDDWVFLRNITAGEISGGYGIDSLDFLDINLSDVVSLSGEQQTIQTAFGYESVYWYTLATNTKSIKFTKFEYLLFADQDSLTLPGQEVITHGYYSGNKGFTISGINKVINNKSPEATGSSYSFNEDVNGVGVLSGVDDDQDSLTYLLELKPSHGVLELNSSTGDFTYIPRKNYFGSDEFTFFVSDGIANSLAQTVLINVVASNDVPTAIDDATALKEDAEKFGVLLGFDVEEDMLSFEIVDNASNGVVIINSKGEYTYTPNIDFWGTDSFTFKVNDGTADSSVATVTLTVDAVNDAPVGFTVSVSGELVAEATLNASVEFTSDADGFDPKSGFQHSWYSSSDQENWTLIEGETASSLTLTDELVGQYIQVTASYTDDLQTVESTSAVTTAAIEALGVNVDVSGHVAARAQTPIPGIELNGLTTNDQGLLQLTKVNGTLPMLPTKAAPSRAEAGITLTDVLGALKVYLGKPLPTAYDNPYKYIAADFQGDGDVDLSDVLSLLKYYLGKPVESAPEWVFADAADEGLAADGNALSKSNATPHVIDHDLTVSSDLELVGILRGDVDGSWMPPAV